MDKSKLLNDINNFASELAQSQRVHDLVILSHAIPDPIDDALKAINERAANDRAIIASLGASLNEVYNQSISSTLSEIIEANTAITSVFESMSAVDSATRSTCEQIIRSREAARALSPGNEFIDVVLDRHAAAVLSASLAAQSKMTAIQSFSLGSAIQASDSFRHSLNRGLERFTTSYNELFNAFVDRPSILAEIAPVITELPPVEAFYGANLLERITVPEDEGEAQEQVEIVIAPRDQSLEDWLHDLDPGFGDLLQGAYDALASSNVDRARHVATSIRELCTHVLHRLAPDDSIRGWTTETCHYHNGRPTRRARLLYICREINIDPLSEFVEADVNAALMLVDALQSGTHRITSRLTDRQLQALVDRVYTLLIFLWRLNELNH